MRAGLRTKLKLLFLYKVSSRSVADMNRPSFSSVRSEKSHRHPPATRFFFLLMKWIIAAAAAVLLIGFVYWQLNSTKTAYVNGLPQYNQLPGREFIFQRDCYIFKFKRHNTEWPLVGANAPGSVMSVPALPAEVSPQYVGAALPEVRILDLARIGDRFKIISVRRETSRRGTHITFEILFINEAERRYPRLDAFWILDHTPEQRDEAPTILPDYAVERVKK